MFKQLTLDQVRDLPLEAVIKRYVPDLKQQGPDLKAKSPFTEEKTASFSVSISKNCWKCFSTGKGGGDGISFVMEKQSLQFYEAVREIATDHGIALDYDESPRAKAYAENVKKVFDINQINTDAMDFFISNKDKIPKNKLRANAAMFEKFSIGFAPDSWDKLTKYLKSKGYSKDMMFNAGLVQRKENGVYDFFRGRVMCPVRDITGKIIGFSGHNIVDSKDQSIKPAKYINTKATDAFDKITCLLGVHEARKSIIEHRHAHLVEGNWDLTSMHEVQITNTVARIGGAFGEKNAKLIKRMADTLTIAVDNDKAGLKNILKDTKTALKVGLNVMLFLPEPGKDPDDMIQKPKKKWKKGEFITYYEKESVEAVDYLAQNFFENAKTIFEITAAQDDLTSLLSIIPDAAIRNAYVKSYAKGVYKIERADVERKSGVEKNIDNSATENDTGIDNLPSYLKQEDFQDLKDFGFYTDEKSESLGYHFYGGSSTERMSNFIIKPLFQVISGRDDSKRILEIRNKDRKVAIAVPNKAFSSNLYFEELVQNEGNYWFNGSKKQFQKLKVKLLEQFPFCKEIRTLGWQSRKEGSGFYAFADGIIENGVFKKVDINGLVEYDDQKYFLPAFSKIYKDMDSEDDLYESDRYFVYRESSITMKMWCEKMQKVHLQNGMWAALFLIAALFRDFIFSNLSYFPHLFMFGQVQTGKSTCARSLSSVFFGNQTPFNLSSGTDVGFYRKIARTKNTIVWFDEYTNEIPEKRFQALKGAYDGAGHERGVMSKDNRTEKTQINAALAISGQYMPTRDDNSLNTRSGVIPFERKAEDVTREEQKVFDELQQWERDGLSNIILETVKFRDHVEDEFLDVLQKVVHKLKLALDGSDFKGRIMNNYAVKIALFMILKDKIDIPFTEKDVMRKAVDRIIEQSEQVADSDALRSYWKMIVFLADQKLIHENKDYAIRTKENFLSRDAQGNTISVEIGSAKKVLFLRLTTVHPLYMEYTNKQTGTRGVNEQSIKQYMKSAKSFLGVAKSVKIGSKTTSAYVFDYYKLDISLEEELVRQTVTPSPALPKEKELFNKN